jgi:hypothetical protein
LSRPEGKERDAGSRTRIARDRTTPSPQLVPILTLAVTVNIMSARALTVFLPALAVDLGTSVVLIGQVPALMLRLL